MADFAQDVKINIELEAKTSKAMAQIGSSLAQIKASANSLGDELDQIEEDLDSFGDSFDKDTRMEIGGGVDSDSIKMSALSALHQADVAIESLRDPKVTIRGRVDIDEEEMQSQVDAETESFKEISKAVQESVEAKEKFSESNAKVEERTKASVTELKREESAFDDIITSGDTLSEVKQKVAGANEHVARMSRESARDIAGEDDAMMELFDSLDVVDRKMRDTSDSGSATRRALNKMRRATDETTDSMRAAGEVGDIFEDGLGSLSVNLGAFTVALRNFLTQVPLLLTALGAAGAAAMGAASSFLALAGALGTVVAAGALGHAQQLKEEYAGIESLGQSMQVIMLNLRDTFMQAFKPLLDNQATVDIFVAAVEGLARIINSAAKEIAGLTRGTEEFSNRVKAGTEPLYTVQEAMSDISTKVGPALRDLFGSLTIAFEELGAEMVAGTAMGVSGLANMVDFSVWLFDQIEDLSGLISQFGDTMADLAVIGTRIGGGLLPVFKAFSTIVETVTEALRTMESETMQNMITFMVLMAAINRVSGVMGSLLTIVPNVVAGMANISAQATAASGSIATMRAATAAAGTQLGGFLAQTSMLGGFTNLATSLTSTGERMRKVAFNSYAASEAFEELADDTDFASDELRELAIQGMFTNEVLDDLGDQDYDITPDKQLDPKQFLPDDPITDAMFGSKSDISDKMDGLFKDLGGEQVSVPGVQGFSQLSDNPFKALQSDSDALGVVRSKMKGLGQSFVNAGKRALTASKNFLFMLGNLVKMQLQAAWTAVTFAGSLAVSFAKSGLAALKAAGRIAYLTAATYAQTGSVKTALVAMWNMITAQNASGAAAARAAVAKFAGAAANLVLAAASYIASSGMLALAASIAVATGGISILLALIGGLAVGIITNFGAIKSAASDSFGFLKEMIDVIVDVLLTYFVTSWNLIVDLFNAVVQGMSPLTDLFMDLAKVIGLTGGNAQDGAKGMGMMAKAGEWAKSAIEVLGVVFGVIIDVLGGVLTIATTLIRLALTPLVVGVHLLMGALDLLSDFWNWIIEDMLGVEGGISGLMDMFMNLFNMLLEGISAIPKIVEDIVNFVIGLVNDFLNAIPFLNLGNISEVSFTKESELKADRDELAEDTANMRDRTAGKGDNTITYNEDNSTNIDQTVNADPEDQAQLSRVVTDAIAEANSFERRRQGGQ
jgi:hypothetical protein